MKITEEALKDNLKLNKLSNLYYFFGKEIFLVKHYADSVKQKFAPDLDEFNFVKFNGISDFDSLEEAIETLPVFAEKKVVLINDFDAEKTDIETLDRIISLFADIPEYCAVIISITGFEPSKNAKTKKLIAAVEKHGVVCEFELLTKPKAAGIIAGRVSKLGSIISLENAEYLYDLTLGSLTLIGSEYKKLCAYAGTGNEITQEIIDRLTPRMTDTKTFNLANALTAKNARTAFIILDELFAQNVEPVIILSSLSGNFINFYRANLGKKYRINHAKVAADFNYSKKQEFLMNKTANDSYIRKCISLLYKADIKLKSTTLNNRTVIEKTMTEILTLQ
jgi:DNA polymerase-3 subunit delta